MTLQEIANFGEILGAAGVIASLVFCWVADQDEYQDRQDADA